ncbi:hypothetical protein ABB55_03535 [Prosthecomicrobium hirschii]|uniref:YjiS-like domain-containing protein n=2 Tax=Prosthecodimorpha TaxID=2981530 RepID=A0A0P6VHB0_9HYPH|nr:DUF1127 domain-containing protein [Prosthecomicrobium hirschii]KPL51413.1 hypothetical protein ABB55_03535 [Prosthecomicrobium hirschii]
MRDAAYMIASQRDGFAPSLIGRLLSGLAALAARAMTYRRRRRALAEIEQLDDYLLSDIGLHRDDLDEAIRNRSWPVARRREERWH